MASLLSVQNVSASYGRQRVLDGVSLELPESGFLALLGRSGCGKTTLLRVIGGFIAPAHGRVLIDGQDMTSLPPEKRPTAMVFQSYALWPHMTVHGNLAYGLRLRGMGKAEITRRIDEILALLQLDNLADRNVTALSGGQRQRVALGRALAVAPRLLLLDEPLSNLDARIRLDLRHEIRSLLKRLGITAVHVTHDREEAMVMADQLALMNDGQIVQFGAPAALYDHPANSFVADFMGASNVITVDLAVSGGMAMIGGDDACPRREIADATLVRAASQGARRLDIRFRSVSARLSECGDAKTPAAAAAVAPGANAGLHLNGTIEQVTYPGDVYRHAVNIGGRSVLIDDAKRFEEGCKVSVFMPFGAFHLFPRIDEQSRAA
ncbi:ABC transporter ATP-binding protein [Thalassospira mesophila]|uniref:ABC transporter domain-containing protein n=1 Tax=Thalassospira mesophila TaxID=1293891 RepID=A0A1Y2L1Z9_9PROT|nr:ABC transporter ATP-binding protein [Thalassospira mesophila]OSQ39506.1 hypothetical protein TMES_05600 [Thalassospira mesophila]